MTKNRLNLRNVVKTVAYLAIVVIFVACDKNNGDNNGNGNGNGGEKGVVINGVRWATRNVGAKGTFVSKPEDYGNYYTWSEAKTACQNGWRLPTRSELESLINTTYVTSEWTTLNDIKGRRFTDKATGNNIFIPAAGFYNPNPGYGMTAVGEYGFYWSNTEAGSGTAYDLWITSAWAILANSGYNYGAFVRCVSNN